MLNDFSRLGQWRTFTTVDGLPSREIEHIVSDQQGNLWMGTWNRGLCSFDGGGFRRYGRDEGICGRRASALLCDRRGQLWVGTEKGVYRGAEGVFYSAFDSECAGGMVQFLSEDSSGRVWCGGTGVLGYWQDESYCDLVAQYERQLGRVPSSQWPLQCWGIAQDGAGDMWFGFDELVRYDGEAFQTYSEEEGLAPWGSAIYAVSASAEGEIWVGAGRRIWHYDGVHFTLRNAGALNIVRKIQRDAQGRLWFVGQGGAVCWDGHCFQALGVRDGLAYHIVNAMYQDVDAQLYFATWGGGLSRCDMEGCRHLGIEDGLPFAEANALAHAADGALWVGFDTRTLEASPVVRIDGDQIGAVGADAGLDLESCGALLKDLKGRLWLGGIGKGLFCYENGSFARVGGGDVLQRGTIRCLDQDSAGRIYCGFWDALERQTSLLCIEDSRVRTLYCSEKDEESTLSIGAVLAGEDGSVFFALDAPWNSEPARGLGHLHSDGQLQFHTVEEGLVDNHVQGLARDGKGGIWCATENGLSHFSHGYFRNFTRADGLPDDNVHCVHCDRSGRLWLGMGSGVGLYDGTVFQRLLLGIDSLMAIAESGDYLFFATYGGVWRYRPGRQKPRLSLVQVVADDVHLAPDALSFSDDVAQIFFEVSARSLRTGPGNMLYQYRIDGVDEAWSLAQTEPRVAYPRLPAGEYVFRARAIDRDLNYSDELAVSLEVKPDLRAQWIGELREANKRLREEVFARQQRETRLAALAAVRSQIWNMERGEDIGDVVGEVRQSLQRVGVAFDSFGINVITEENSVESYTIVEEELQKLKFEVADRVLPLIRSRNEPVYRPDLEREDPYGERGQINVQHSNEQGQADPQQEGDGILRCILDVPFSHGTLAISSEQPNAFSEGDIGFVVELAAVFSEGFRRMEDLRVLHAEIAQRERREIQLDALQEVRRTVWMMKDSGEIKNVVLTVREGLKKMGIAFQDYGINVIKKEGDQWLRDYYFVHANGLYRNGTLGVEEEIDLIMSFWRGGVPVYRRDLESEDRYGELPDMNSRLKKRVRSVLDVPFSHGSLGLNSAESDAFSVEAIALVQEMVAVLSEGFQRFDDLRDLETHNAELEMRNSELERFTYTVSHDLKSPLVTIRGFLGLLQKDIAGGETARAEEDMEQIRKASDHMYTLLDELLELSRIGRLTNPAERVDMGELAREAVQLVQGRLDECGAIVQVAGDMGVVWGDRQRLLEVYQNLLDNAAKFTGGQEEPHVEIGVRAQGDEKVYYVRDNGMGIEKAYLEKIFGLFERLEGDGGGTGIGLALIKRIVEVHGGQIWAESAGKGLGTAFFFTLGRELG